jgi:glycosyltransferase involved in cell wall biosynthesis
VVRDARTEIVVVVGPTGEPIGDDWLDRLTAPFADPAVAACGPLVVHPVRPWRRATPHDGRVRQLGLDVVVEGGRPSVVGHGAGTTPDVAGGVAEVAALSGPVVAIRRTAALALEPGLPADDLDAAVIELAVRLRHAGGKLVANPGAVVVDHSPVADPAHLDRPVPNDGERWSAVVDRVGPLLVRTAEPERPLRLAVTISAPSTRVAPRWGDWHLAEALARSLARRDVEVALGALDRADGAVARSCDVHLVVRGKARVRRTSGQHHVLWIMSHPDEVTTDECDEADLVLVASEAFAAHLRTLTTTPVEVLLQATDHRRFSPLPPDPRFAHPVAIVANARHTRRRIVDDALAAGLRPAVYGRGWAGRLDPDLVVAEQVPNDELPALYSSVGVLLNDHWEDMRRWGFVSNRLFDALACATPVISDAVPAVVTLFGDTIPTYTTPDELRSLVEHDLGAPGAARERAHAGRRLVMAAHTFDDRADELLAALRRLGLDAGRTPAGP